MLLQNITMPYWLLRIIISVVRLFNNVIDRGYDRLFYTSKDLKYVDVENQLNNRYRVQDRNMVLKVFSMTMKTRPLLVIAKLEEYFREKTVIVRSNRLIDELFVFIYNNNKVRSAGL